MGINPIAIGTRIVRHYRTGASIRTGALAVAGRRTPNTINIGQGGVHDPFFGGAAVSPVCWRPYHGSRRDILAGRGPAIGKSGAASAIAGANCSIRAGRSAE